MSTASGNNQIDEISEDLVSDAQADPSQMEQATVNISSMLDVDNTDSEANQSSYDVQDNVKDEQIEASVHDNTESLHAKLACDSVEDASAIAPNFFKDTSCVDNDVEMTVVGPVEVDAYSKVSYQDNKPVEFSMNKQLLEIDKICDNNVISTDSKETVASNSTEPVLLFRKMVPESAHENMINKDNNNDDQMLIDIHRDTKSSELQVKENSLQSCLQAEVINVACNNDVLLKNQDIKSSLEAKDTFVCNDVKNSLPIDRIDHERAFDSVNEALLTEKFNVTDEKSLLIDISEIAEVSNIKQTFFDDTKETSKIQLKSIDNNKVSLLTNDLKIPKTEEFLEIKTKDISLDDTESIKSNTQSFDQASDKSIKINDEDILKLTQNLCDRDFYIYEQTYIKNSFEQSLEIGKDTNVNTNILLDNQPNVNSDNKSLQIEKSSDILDNPQVGNSLGTDDKLKPLSLIVDESNITTCDNLLQFEESHAADKIKDKVSLLTDLVNSNDINGKDTLKLLEVDKVNKVINQKLMEFNRSVEDSTELSEIDDIDLFIKTYLRNHEVIDVIREPMSVNQFLGSYGEKSSKYNKNKSSMTSVKTIKTTETDKKIREFPLTKDILKPLTIDVGDNKLIMSNQLSEVTVNTNQTVVIAKDLRPMTSIKDDLPDIEENAIKDALKPPIVKDNDKKLLESNESFDKSEKSSQANASVANETNTSQNLENKHVNSNSSDINSSATVNKKVPNEIKEPDVINKLQGMNWLKTQSSSPVSSMSRIANQVKSLPKKEERSEDYFEGTKKGSGCRRTRSGGNAQNKNRNEQLSNPPSEVKPTDHPKQVVWNNDTAKQLFPDTQSIVINSQQEQEEMEQAIAESICTAHQESERRKMAEPSLKIKIRGDSDEDEWGKVHSNLPDTSQVELKNEVDNNQNYAKGFVDKFGRVDGCSEKHLFMGKGARRREQEFLKSQTEHKPQPQNHQGFLQAQSSANKPIQDLNPQQQSKKESKNEQLPNKTQSVDESKKETQLLSKSRERPIHGRADNEINVCEPEFLVSKKQQKPGFNQGPPKNVNQGQKESQNFPKRNEDNQRHLNRNQENSDNRQQNVPDRHYDNTNKNPSNFNRPQNQFGRHEDISNRKQESYNRVQNYFDRNRDSQGKNQDLSHRNMSSYDRNQVNNRNFPEKNEDTVCRYHDSSNRTQNYSDRNQDRFGRNQNYSNRNQESTNKIQGDLNKNQQEDWDKEEVKKVNLNSQKHLDNNSSSQRHNINNSQQQQMYNQRGPRNKAQDSKSMCSFQQNNSNLQVKKDNLDKKIDLPTKIGNPQEKPNDNVNLPKNNIPVKQQSNTSLGLSVDLKSIPHHSTTPNTSELSSTSQEIKKEFKQEFLTSEPPVSFGGKFNLPAEPKRNVVMTFEGNQNIQCALGMNPNIYNASIEANNQQISKVDLQASNVNDFTELPHYTNLNMVQNMPFSQSNPLGNINTSIAYTNSTMNVNAPTFDATNFSATQGLSNPYSGDIEHAMPITTFGYFPSNVEEQHSVNEISNLSQEMTKWTDEVNTYAQKLQFAQANLLAVQSKLYKKGVLNPHGQLVHPNLPAIGSNQVLVTQNQSPSITPDFTKYSAPPGFSVSAPNVHKVQADTYEMTRSATPVNMQEFAGDKFHSTVMMDQRLNLAHMYVQQGNLYQHQVASVSQYGANIAGANTLARGRMIPHNERREFRGNNPQFYSQNN